MPEDASTTGQTAAPTSAGNDTPASGSNGQAAASPAQTSPGAAPAPTSAPAKDVLVAKVFGSEIPVDLSDRTRVQELIQKGLAFDTAKDKFEERANARAQEILREQAQKQAEDQRMAQLREQDPLAYEFENYKKADAEKAQAIEHQVRQLQDTLHNLTWNQQVAEAKRQYPDLSQDDWNYAYAQVVASNGQVGLAEAAMDVKVKKETFVKQVEERLLQTMKANARTAPPAVPSGGGAPVFQGEPPKFNFEDKDSMRSAVKDYLAGMGGRA